MIIEVKIFYYSVFGKGSLSLEFKKDKVTVQDVLSRLEQDYGKEFMQKSSRNLSESFGTYFNIFLNGEHLSIPEQVGTKLKDKDRMIILRPVSGG